MEEKLSYGNCRTPLAHFTIHMQNKITNVTVCENGPKSRIQYCERSELRLHYEWTKIHQKCQNGQLSF